MMDITLEGDRYIVFTIGIYNVALPIHQVLRIIRNQSIPVQPSPSAHPEALQSMGLIQVGKRLIRVLNIEKLFTPVDSTPTLAASGTSGLPDAIATSQLSTPSFFVITKNHQNELCGIPTTSPPNLMNWPQEWVKPLPPSKKDSDLAQVVSHFVTLTDTDTEIPIFLLSL